MKNIYNLASIFVIALISFPVFSQNPSDGCAGVPSLTVNSSCITTAYTLNGSYTNGGLVLSGTCVAGLDRDDGWYSFVATSTSTTIDATGDLARSVVIWTACGGGTELGCDIQTAGTTASVTVATSIGVTYYIQLHRRSGNNTATMTGTICVYDTPVSGGCIPNTVIASIPYSQTGLNTSGTGDDFTSSDACSSLYMDGDDYVFTYTPVANECINISLTNTGTYVGVFVTDACPSSAGANCIASNTNSGGNPSVSGVNLTAGTTYFITVSTWPAPQSTPFDISIISCPPPPANDEPCNAIAATVNPDLLCGTVTAGTVASATNSGISACVGSGADDDVWFSFVATSTVLNFDLLNITGSTTDMVFEIFSGACGSLGSVACSDPESNQFTGFTVGVTYYLRVYTYTATGGQNTTFDLCIGTPPPPPSNDEPCGAINLSVNIGSCSYQSGVLSSSATISTGMPAPGCSSLGPDVWYKVTVPAGGLIIDLSPSGGPTDMGMAWYTGPSCNNLTTLVECDDDDSQNGLMPMICRTGASCTVPGDCAQNPKLATGTVVYIRIWEYGGGTSGPFDICAYEPAAPGAPSNCASATTIPGLPYSSSGETTCCRVNNYNATTGCLSVYQGGEDFMYTYTPSANETIDVTLTGTLSYTGLFITDNCPSTAGVNCVASATSASGNPTLCAVNLTGGTTYYIMVDTDPSPSCTPFNINVTNSSTPTCGLNYTMSSIPYSPDLNAGTNIALPIDDRFTSSYIPLGFNFCFNGYEFTQGLISSNGYVVFDPIGCASNLPGGNAAPGAYSAWSINAAIPNTTDAPRNSIMFPWQDVDPSLGGTIKYQVLGSAPNRRFVVTFDQVPYFSCNALKFTGQLKLFETTNNIEIHIANKEICAGWNGGDAILGLHNFNGTIAVTNAGHNYPTNWNAVNEAWRFTYNCPGPCITVLPVTLVEFDGKTYDGYNLLDWETASEINNDHFVLERSDNGIDFEELATIPGGGNSSSILKYNHQHNDPKELEYYRLKQVDYDGKFKYSKIIALNSKKGVSVNIYPNPSKDDLYFNLSESSDDIYTIVYTNILGSIDKEQIQISKGTNSYKTNDFNGLSPGIYFIQILNDKNEIIKTDKIIKE